MSVVEPRPARSSRITVTTTVLVALALTVPGWSWAAAAAACWQPPVEAPVTDPFRAPTCPYCAGNRGIEYGTLLGAPVRAVAAGRVTFAGAVAGTVYLVVEHAGGLRVTYGNLDDRTVGVGDAVVRGMLLGSTAGRFHLGLRRGDTYLDPGPFIGVWRGIVRLVPTDGSPGVRTHARRLVCHGASTLGVTTGPARPPWSRGFPGEVR